MNYQTISNLLVLIALGSCSLVSKCPAQELPAAQPKSFELLSLDGKTETIRLGEDFEFTVLCFTGVECPLAKLYAPRLVQIAEEFSDRSVGFIGINSNQQDSLVEFAEFATRNSIPFKCYKDMDNVVADQFEVKRTPEVVVVDRNGRVKYRGRIDDQYLPGISRPQPQRQDLRIALQELTSDQAVSIARTEPDGCLIGRV